MSDTTARIRAKGCESTGLDEALAEKMHGQVGKFYMAIVEVKVEQKHGPDAEGKKGVDLVITQLEPAGHGSDLDAHLRDLTRAAYLSRGDNGQLSLTSQSDVEPTVEELVRAGLRHKPHDFVPDTTDGAGMNTWCDVCGEDADHGLHDGKGPAVEEPATPADDPNQITTEAPDGHKIHNPAAPANPGDKDLANPSGVTSIFSSTS